MSSEFNLLLTYTKMDNPEGIARLVTRYPDGNFTGGFKDRYPMTKFPLEIACVNRYHTVLRALLNVSGVDPNAKTFSKKTPLCLVLEAKDLIGFVILINDPRTDLNIICKGLLAYYRPITQLMWHRPVFLRHLIASGKPVDTGLLREAETNPEFKEEYLALLNLYEADPEVARHEAQAINANKFIRWPMNHAAHLFALVVMVCDGLLQVKGEGETQRWLAMVTRLPMELQMMACLRAVGVVGTDFVPTKDFEVAFRSLKRVLVHR